MTAPGFQPPSPPLPTMTNLEFARYYATIGFPVIALWWPIFDGGVRCACRRRTCSSIGKHPMPRRGVHAATTNLALIGQWFKRYPLANIGLACGLEFDVLDVDDLALAELLIGDPRALYYSSEGPIARTGKGAHFYFEPQGATRVIPGVGEWRSSGAYVVAPPSVHASGRRYAWVDGHDAQSQIPLPSRKLLERVLLGEVRSAGSSPDVDLRTKMPVGLEDAADLAAIARPDRYMAAVVRRAAERLARAPKGARNTMLNREAFQIFVAARRHGVAIDRSEVEAALLEACVTNGYLQEHNRSDALKTIDSAFNGAARHV